jgi:cytochrome P450
MIHTVLVTRAGEIEKPAPLKRIFRGSFGNGLFFSEGSFWRRQRKLAQPAFHSQRIQPYAEVMVRRAREMIRPWQPGQIVDLRKEMSAATLKVVVDTLFHASVDAETEPIYLALRELADIVTQQTLHPLLALMPDGAPLPLMRRKRRVSAALDAIVYRFIRERRASEADRGDLLSMLMLAEDDDGQRMSDQQLHDEIMTVFIAGHETTALALTWAFVLLARHPEAEARLHAEVD